MAKSIFGNPSIGWTHPGGSNEFFGSSVPMGGDALFGKKQQGIKISFRSKHQGWFSLNP